MPCKSLDRHLCISYSQLVFVLVLIFSISSNIFGLPAFPGAQGFGSYTPGGRGGKIIEVTNLRASGTGSLRSACEASGPRIVVFRTGGMINISRAINIRNPFITIAFLINRFSIRSKLARKLISKCCNYSLNTHCRH